MYVHQTIEYDNNLPGRIRLFDSPDGKTSVEAHWHEEIELIYVDSGTLFVTVNDSEHELKRGDVIVLGAKTIHSMTGWEARYLSVHFSDLFVRSFFRAIGEYDFELQESSQARREMTLLMQKLLAIEQNTFDPYNALAKYSLMIKMLRLLLTRCCKKKVTPADVGGKRNTKSDAQIIRQYIEENYRRKILIGEIAELVDIATMYITPYFKKLMGKSFVTYLNEVRVNHALDDYLTHDVPVCEAGVSFERPGFQEMYKLIEAGKVGIVITKDLSRLGRNYIEVGNFTEFVFPRYGVRYIAINDNYDSLFSENNELAPFKNLFNEWYARDTSKKIRSVFKTKAERGERLNDKIPYGYRPDPASGKKYSLLINEETASVVRLIYNLCTEGNGPNAIAAVLKEKKIYKPSMYRYLHDGFLGKTDINDPYGWNPKTVGNILDNEVYLGHTVMWKSSVVSFKDKRVVARPKEEQYRFENTHEPIISKETWDIVREVRGSKRRKTSMGEVSKFSGLVYCADCGCKHYFERKRAWKPENYGFICSRYRKHLGEEICTPHKIRESVLDVIVLEEINKALYYARNNTKEFVDYISRKSSSQTRRELNAKTSELAKAEKRIKELKSLFKRLYEDNVLGRISDEQYRMLSADYNDEQKQLESKLPELNKEIDALNNECTNVQRFMDLAQKYTCITELTPDILRTFISKIVVHERAVKHSKTAPQQIDIYFRYIGNLTAPKSEEVA